MKNLFTFVGMALIMALSLFLAVITGDYGPWYFAWLVGTTMIVPVSYTHLTLPTSDLV